jgi:rhodanese-related sulfurtransferase
LKGGAYSTEYSAITNKSISSVSGKAGKNLRNFWPKQSLIILGIVLLSLCIGLVSNQFRAQPLPLVQDWSKTIEERTRKELQAQGVKEISFEAMAEAVRLKKALILDARPKDFFLLEHIPEARSLPVKEFEKYTPQVLKDYSQLDPIIIYCEGGACPDSSTLAQKIRQAGWLNVSVYTGGIMEWQEKEMPVKQEEDF